MAPRGSQGFEIKVAEDLAALRTKMEGLEEQNGHLRTAVDLLLQLKGGYDREIPDVQKKIDVLFEKEKKSYERTRNLEGSFGLLTQTVERLEEAAPDLVTRDFLKASLKSYDFWLRIGLGGMAIAIITAVLTAIAKVLGWA